MNTSYESDVVAWAKEQAALIRAGQFDQLDAHGFDHRPPLDVGEGETGGTAD